MCDYIYPGTVEFPEGTLFYKIVNKFKKEYYSFYTNTALPVGRWLVAENIDPATYPKSLTPLQKHIGKNSPGSYEFGHAYNRDVKGFSAFQNIPKAFNYANYAGVLLYALDYRFVDEIVIVECHLRGIIQKAMSQGTIFFLGEELKIVRELSSFECLKQLAPISHAERSIL